MWAARFSEHVYDLLSRRCEKRVTQLMMNFKSFRSTRSVLAVIGLMRMIRKGLLLLEGCCELSSSEQFYALAGQIRSV